MPDYALLTVYLLALASAISVSAWAATSAPTVLKPYFTSEGQPAPTASSLLYLTALVQGFSFFLALKDPFIAATVPLCGLFALMILTDSAVHKLPNRLTAMSAGYLAFGVCVALFGPTRFDYLALASSAAVGALIWTVPLWILHRVGAGVGGGDVKLAPVIGAWLGLYGTGIAASGLGASFIFGGAVALILLATGKVGWKSSIAFGPAMIAGALVTWFATGYLVSPG
ncbi:MAG: prepilin peptidase [Actinomycetaceae bacterium]|nr:prepilin peptidase [Actinomycetaceae bacterium]